MLRQLDLLHLVFAYRDVGRSEKQFRVRNISWIKSPSHSLVHENVGCLQHRINKQSKGNFLQ